MGNNASKDSSGGGRQRRSVLVEVETSNAGQQAPTIYGPGSGSRRGSRHEIPFLHRSSETQTPQRPKETRQEKEARRAERERQARLAERERSVKEESVDGGFLVTLGTYTGPEDFSKPIVRQLQIERRLAPFWKGLNDHSDSWTEHQLVSAVRGLPIPAADEIPEQSPVEQAEGALAVPSPYMQPPEAQLSTSPSIMSTSAPLTPVGTSPFFRGRSKTLASLTGPKTPLPDLTPQEVQLPRDPNVNGLPIEAYLYREPGECPICFLYYPPYLNKTRCCDQPICSECFVQIKRPDPHPPEHEQPGQQRTPEEEAGLLISEVAACPFCVAPEFGITYEPPPFRRGLTYANNANVRTALSAASSQTSFQSGERRRNISISASAPEVVTTDKVRPDWAKKLADARAHVLRRSAAATALHNAAYVLGNQESLFRGAYGRRRRSILVDSPNGSGSQTPGDAAAGSDLFPGRTSSRRNRVEDLEDLMMMEAIRLSLAAEEERKRKEDKEKAKEEKKKAKESKKEAKQLEKLAKKHGSTTSLYNTHSNDSTSTWATTSMVRSSSNLGTQLAIPEEVHGKGKAPMQDGQGALRSRSGSNVGDAQRHLEESRATIQSAPSNPIPMQRRGHPRQLSNASSLASSLVESVPGSYNADSPSPGGSGYEHDDVYQGTPAIEPLLNYRSLAAMIESENKESSGEHVEHVAGSPSKAEDLKEPSPAASPTASITIEGARQREDSGESSSGPDTATTQDNEKVRLQTDQKTSVHVLEHEQFHEATQ